jgi:hypothetical protein
MIATGTAAVAVAKAEGQLAQMRLLIQVIPAMAEITIWVQAVEQEFLSTTVYPARTEAVVAAANIGEETEAQAMTSLVRSVPEVAAAAQATDAEATVDSTAQAAAVRHGRT